MKSRYEDSLRRQLARASGEPAIRPAPAPTPAAASPAPAQPSGPTPASAPAPAADLLFAKAVASHQAGQLAQAEALYRQILRAVPRHAGALNLLGVIASQVGQHASAIELIDQAIEIQPQYAEAHHNRGSALVALHRYDAAVRSFDQAIRLRPDDAEAYHHRAGALGALGQYQAALASYDKAVQLRPAFAAAWFGRGTALEAMQQHQAAVESYNQAIRLQPDDARAYYNRGNALNALQQPEAALASYDKAIQLQPGYAQAYCNRGILLCVLEQYQAALESCDRALQLQPGLAEACFGQGTALYAMERYRSALESFDRAILLMPGYAEAHNNRGNTLLALKQYEAALRSYDNAILLQPNRVETHNNRGNALQTIGQYQAALESYDNAFLLDPEYNYLAGTRLFMRRFVCIWEDVPGEWQQLEAPIARGLKVAPPFASLAFSESPAIQRQAAEIYVRDRAPERPPAAAIPGRRNRDKIRIGYFSTDYYNNATSYLMAEIFELHDRERFEVLAFSFGPDVVDEMSQRVSAAMDQFLDIRAMTDIEAAALSRRLGVDIAVDLKGHTLDHRAAIFAERAAPIQVNYLGYPGSMGAGYMDYLIGDLTVIPETSQKYYSEKVIYLPDSYQCNDSRRAISSQPCTRQAEGLPENAVVFCCFNNSYKITPEMFDVWMRILGRVEGSVLWLWENKPWATGNLRRQAQRRGISPDRLVFARTLPLDEHLARHRLADLFLDTYPYNAHTTASHALWTGLPVLTRMGETFASRVAASLLRGVHLPELITTTGAEFEQLAVELAHHPQRLQELRRQLDENRLTAPLFNSRAFTRHLEAAYQAVVERYDAGLPPGHIVVPRIPERSA